MKLSTAVDRAIAAENRDPQGLPMEVFAAMEADILANPDKYPAIYELLTRDKD